MGFITIIGRNREYLYFLNLFNWDKFYKLGNNERVKKNSKVHGRDPGSIPVADMDVRVWDEWRRL